MLQLGTLRLPPRCCSIAAIKLQNQHVIAGQNFLGVGNGNETSRRNHVFRNGCKARVVRLAAFDDIACAGHRRIAKH